MALHLVHQAVHFDGEQERQADPVLGGQMKKMKKGGDDLSLNLEECL